MPLFGKSDEAEKRFKKASKLLEEADRELDIEEAIHHLEEAVMLKPYEEKYRKQLEEVKTMKQNLSKKFLMNIDDVFQIKGRGIPFQKGSGTIVTGIVQQGIIHSGDKVRIVGRLGDRTDTIIRIEKFSAKEYTSKCPEGIQKTLGFINTALLGNDVGLELTNLRVDEVERGDVIEKFEA